MHYRIRQFLWPIQRHISLIKAAADAERRETLAEIRAATPDNPCLMGFQSFSQNDEDGIIQEIFRRLGGGKTFLEIGCGDGLQNNTHYLALQGWRGTWVDGGEKNIARIKKNLPDRPDRLRVVQRYVDADNVGDLIAYELDFLSLDIDGNDLYVLKGLLRAGSPKVICLEYNSAFPPPMSIAIKYDPAHRWALDMYMGASLQAFVDALPQHRLVSCNITGTNAFFVREDLAKPFAEYPVAALYRPYKPQFFYTGHEKRPTFKFLENELSRHG